MILAAIILGCSCIFVGCAVAAALEATPLHRIAGGCGTAVGGAMWLAALVLCALDLVTR